MERRRLLKLFVNGIGLAVGGVLAVPAVLMALSPVTVRRRGETWVPLGALDAFIVGDVRRANVPIPREAWDWASTPAEKAVYIFRRTDDEVVVYSRNCTDLSCPLTWDQGSGWFYCPCHGGIFCREGEPRAGPPSRPMFRYTVRVRDGIVEIDLNSLPPIT